MSKMPEMLVQRPILASAGVTFEAITNHDVIGGEHVSDRPPGVGLAVDRHETPYRPLHDPERRPEEAVEPGDDGAGRRGQRPYPHRRRRGISHSDAQSAGGSNSWLVRKGAHYGPERG
jgi:hypothetical protein